MIKHSHKTTSSSTEHCWHCAVCTPPVYCLFVISCWRDTDQDGLCFHAGELLGRSLFKGVDDAQAGRRKRCSDRISLGD